jgi:hypothetical protein
MLAITRGVTTAVVLRDVPVASERAMVCQHLVVLATVDIGGVLPKAIHPAFQNGGVPLATTDPFYTETTTVPGMAILFAASRID